MNVGELFSNNLQVWSKLLPRSAELFQASLLKSQQKKALAESDLIPWFTQLPLQQYEALIIYGIGNGASYKLLRPWLQGNSKRVLIFLEDQPESVKYFFSSPLAKALLNDRQAWLFFGNTENDLERGIHQFSFSYPFHEVFFTTLPGYDSTLGNSLQAIGRFIWLRSRETSYEYQHASKGLTHNLYANLFLLPESRQFASFQNAFRDTPAVIVGAGPSLSKNRHLLSSLKDRALIIAGGTAINALNAGQVQPHLAVGIDPNHQFYNRILSNTAWEVPFIYYYRMYHRALSLVHGEKIFFNLSPGISIADWLHSELKVSFPVFINKEFFNVINLATYLAIVMGCNPILFVGVDLAYTDDCSYAQGLQSIASQAIGSELRSKSAYEQVVTRKDIFGKPIKTLWKWILESLWYSKLKIDYPQTTFVNCTEGGLGFQGIANTTLDMAISQYCTKPSLNIRKIQSLLRDSPLCSQATPDEISHILKKLDTSLQRCAQVFSSKNPLEESLAEEPAFIHILSIFNRYLKEQAALFLNRLEALKETLSPEEYENQKHAIHTKRHQSILQVILNNRASLAQALEMPHLSPLVQAAFYPPSVEEMGVVKSYYPNGVLKSVIPLLDQVPHGEILLYYHTGSLSRRLHYSHGVKDGLEEIWDRGGQLLVEATYKNGLPVGTAQEWHFNGVLAKKCIYDQTGKLISMQKWNTKGETLVEQRDVTDTYLKEMQKQIILLKDALQTIEKHLIHLYPSNETLKKEIKIHLVEVDSLIQKSGTGAFIYSKDTYEPLWYTPQNTDDLAQDIVKLTQTVEEYLKKIETTLREAPSP